MIPQSHIAEWRNNVPWQFDEQVEQDLVICRALVEIFNDPFLSENLAFRGGTALHKLYLSPQPRYSEDIDLVQIKAAPIGETIDRIREVLSFLGQPKVKLGKMTTVKFSFDSEMPPSTPLRLKVETNCQEHFAELGWIQKDFSVQSDWFSGSCKITTYQLEELLGTKLRALYQRRKGRDLFDLHRTLTHSNVNIDNVLNCYKKYMEFSVGKMPSQKEFLQNMEEKMSNDQFKGDIKALIRVDEKFNQEEAFELIKSKFIDKM